MEKPEENSYLKKLMDELNITINDIYNIAKLDPRSESIELGRDKRGRIRKLRDLAKEIGKKLDIDIPIEVWRYKDFELVIHDRKIRASSEYGNFKDELDVNLDEISKDLGLMKEGAINKEQLKNVGGRLFHSLFPEEIRIGLHETLSYADIERYGVRLRLQFEDQNLAVLPWELIYDEKRNIFLATDPRIALSRHIDVPLKRQDIATARPPLRALLIISTPTDRKTLDISGEKKQVKKALPPGVEIDELRKATVSKINKKLEKKSYNIIHFIGHGDFDHERGFVDLVDENSKARPLDDEDFSKIFLGHQSIGLVVLNSCEGAALSSNDAFAGMAPRLVQRGIPAVVAMQYRIRDSTAKFFSAEFYHYLALGYPVDKAIQLTRKTMSINTDLNIRDFATPVLYMHARDGVIMSGL